MRFTDLNSATRQLWAKSGEGDGHGLLAHLLDVAAVVETLLAMEPDTTRQWAAKALGLDVAHVARWVAAIAGLHDFGKAIPGFQAKWAEGMQADQARGFGFPSQACAVDRHDLATSALLVEALDGQQLAQTKWLRHVVQAISAHHGYHFLPDEVSRGTPFGEPALWRQARGELLTCYWQLLAPPGQPSLKKLSLAAVNWLAGLTSTADWIASNPEWFALGQRGFDDLHAYHEDAQRLAREALRQIGWHAYHPLLTTPMDVDALVARIVGRPDLSARPLQQAGDRLLQVSSGPSLLLVEAPMGEGKTELAFLAHLRLQAANGHRGLYVALPTQATGNALFSRAETFLRAFTDQPLDLQLVHGGAAMSDEARRLRDVHLHGVNENADDTLSASAWFSQRKRPLLSPYGVGTVDQALFATLNVKHHFVHLWGLANRVVVLDEVHAYDTYTSGLIDALLGWLKALGCSVVLMSATLPSVRRAELLRAWGVAGDDVPEYAYPRLLLADDHGVKGEHFKTRNLAPIHLAGLGEGLDEMVDTAIGLLEGGGCGALIVNTVDRAQTLFTRLREQLGESVPLLLFHARFPADERAEREKQLLNSFGPKGVRPTRALLIGTQVLQESLDYDVDFMISDLAPVDLLLQRAGRLHRHERERPTQHAQACLRVAGLRRESVPELKDTAWGFVYDPYILLRTWALLRDEHTLQLPGDIDRLVQAVYSDDQLPPDLERTVRERIEIDTYGEYLAKVKAERQMSFNIALDPEESPEVAYHGRPRGSEEGEGLGLENKTRLGSESIILIPVEVVGGQWCVQVGEPLFGPDHSLPDALARQLYRRQLKTSRTALVKRFKSEAVPVAFEHPLLRNCYPLPLRQGRYDENGVHLRLDRLLGLVFEPAEAINEEKQ